MNTSKYKLIIFDLDGTLINSVSDLAIATNYALRQFELPEHHEDKYRFFVGNGLNKLLERALPKELQTTEWIDKLKAVMLPFYTEHCTDTTVPYKGITELLDCISASGTMIAVASNKYHTATVDMVRHFFPNINFVSVLGQRDGVPPKPSPKIIYDTLLIAKVEPSEVLYVGDTAVDMKTAKNTNLTAVGVSWGFRPRTELESEQPQFIADSVKELKKIIFSSQKNHILKPLFIAFGTVAVALGVLGIFLPLLPTTPFLLLAAALFARSSDRLYSRLINNKYLGEYIRDFREHKSIPLRTKIYAITIMFITMGYTIFFVVEQIWLKILLLAIAIGVSIHIASYNTKTKK